MSTLEVPGARLHYDTRGAGPLLLMIPGAAGHGEAFAKVADHLAAHHTVVTYDRRGYSRSRLDGPQNDEHRLATDADDVRRLIEHLSDEPAIVFGTSSGGNVALVLLTNHPSAVRTLISYEPAAIRELPDAQKWLGFFHRIYDLYHTAGVQPALKAFREKAFSAADLKTMAHGVATKSADELRANAVYWFEHELRQYPTLRLDIGCLIAHADRIVLASGRESRGYPCYEVNLELAKKLGLNMFELPGGHLGFASRPADFATELHRIMREHDAGYQPKT